MSEERENKYHLRSGLAISPAQQAAIDQALVELAVKIPAQFVLLTDVTGQLVSAAGDRANVNLVGLGSLVAGDLAASQEIARMTGHYDTQQMILREGQQANSFIVEAGPHLALFAQASFQAPLGWARLLIKYAANYLAAISATMTSEELPELDFSQQNLEELFGSALADLWVE